MRRAGRSVGEATASLECLSPAAKNELLFEQGVNFNELPLWQRRGVGLWWETFDRPGIDRRTGEPTTARRRRIRRELELPMKEAYSELVRGLLSGGAA